LLVRVEEYDETDLDEHGRFRAESSSLFSKGLLGFPVVDGWVATIKQALTDKFGLALKEDAYSLLSTIDVDHLYAYKHKSAKIKYGSILKDLIKLDFQRLRDRSAGKDPYARIDEMLDWHEAEGVEPIFFVLTAQRSTYDKSLSPSSLTFISDIASLSTRATVGLHPSYASNVSPHILKKEKKDLTAIVGREITKSRQHFLKLSFPDTYRRLISQGVKEDYSLGYASQVGFRAGTSRPFYWFDLHQDKTTDLRLVPFTYMDITLKRYLAMTPEAARLAISDLHEAIKAVNGQCCFIWHNSSFYEAEGWAGWEEVYKSILSSSNIDA